MLQVLRLRFVQYNTFSLNLDLFPGFSDIILMQPRVTATLGFNGIINLHPCGVGMIPPSRSDELILAVNLNCCG